MSAQARPLQSAEVTGARRATFRGIPRLFALLVIAAVLLMGVAPDLVATFDARVEAGPPLFPPSKIHLLGTDDLGRDLMSMIVTGTRGTLLLTVVVVTLTYLTGGVIGLAAGYFGGVIDAILMRSAEFIAVLPRLLVLLLYSTLITPSLTVTAIILSLTSWPGLARMVRAETISQKHGEHIIAARALGCSEWHIIRHHLSTAAMRATYSVMGPICVSAILIEASLGFLGLSDPSFISWGDLIRNGQLFFYQGWWLAVFPGLTILLVCIAIAIVTETEPEMR